MITAVAPGAGYRNFLGDDPQGQRFGIGLFNDGMIDDASRAALQDRIRNLAIRILQESTDDDPENNNPDIPSGYTYLLQFMAHDMVDSVTSWTVSGDRPGFAFHNARQAPLCLNTLYGQGPTSAPHAYEPSKANLAHPDGAPPTRLKLGPPRTRPAGDRMNIARDIGRGVDTSIAREQKPGNWPTGPLLVDPRNDAHALMSQITALFACLHNTIMQLVDPPSAAGAGQLSMEEVYRRFLCARMAVTLVYRAIIVADVLPKLLHPSIKDLYVPGGKPAYDKLRDSGKGIPVEFSHGAFRFAHAMVRSAYSVNALSVVPQDFARAFEQTSSRSQEVDPLKDTWLVDWDRFFNGANLSRLIKPRYPIALLNRFDAQDPDRDTRGLADRDLLSACYARCWSVNYLCTRMRGVWGENLVPAYEPTYRDDIKNWIDDDSIGDAVAADPPLPFFIQFEAMKAAGGRTLGPVGSIIVAETILGAIKQNPVNGLETQDVADQLTQCAKVLLPGNPDALKPVAAAKIDSMPKLLTFLADNGAFGNAPH